MCEEELKIFEPKMNNESLARHLQSLRQFYTDLKIEKVSPIIIIIIIIIFIYTCLFVFIVTF